jgi:anti-anti-sigma factor
VRSELVTIPNLRLLQYETDGKILVVIPQGDCSSLEAAVLDAELQEILTEVSAHEITGVVIDLERAPFFGSTMLGGLIRLWREMAELKGRLVLCNVSPAEQDILNATRLDSVWQIHASRTAAVAALRAN